MPVDRRVGCFVLLLHLLVLMAVYKHDIYTFSLLKSVQDSESVSHYVRLRYNFYNKSCRMTAQLDCDWLGFVHVFEFLEGKVGVG